MKVFKHITMLWVGLAVASCSLTPTQHPKTNNNTSILKNIAQGHPRLFYKPAQKKMFLQATNHNPLAKWLNQQLIHNANILLNTPTQPYHLDRRSVLLSQARQALKVIAHMAFAYQNTGQQKYLDRAIAEIKNTIAYPNWNHQNHFLDVAEISTALAIGYDLLHSHLPDSLRQATHKAIYKKGILPFLAAHQQADTIKQTWWTNTDNNWNVVCNGGMAVAALAIAEHYPDSCARTVQIAINKIPVFLHNYAPDGAYYEGPAYWGYAAEYFAITITALQNALSSNFGLPQMPGVQATANYLINTHTPAGKLFNFADAKTAQSSIKTPLIWWAKQFNQPQYNTFVTQQTKQAPQHLTNVKTSQRLLPLALEYYANHPNPQAKPPPPTAAHYKGPVPIAVMQQTGSSFFVALIGGKGTLTHQQLDAGTFILEHDSVLWASDPGSENYFLPGFWELQPNGRRWLYRRNQNLHHNTPTINYALQHPDSLSTITKFTNQIYQTRAVINLTGLYPNADSVYRTFVLKNGNQLTITDRATGLQPNDTLSTFWITEAQAQINQNKLILSHKGKKFAVTIAQPKNAVWHNVGFKSNHPEARSYQGLQRFEARHIAKNNTATITLKAAPIH